jgi:hypothetical protein
VKPPMVLGIGHGRTGDGECRDRGDRKLVHANLR